MDTRIQLRWVVIVTADRLWAFSTWPETLWSGSPIGMIRAIMRNQRTPTPWVPSTARSKPFAADRGYFDDVDLTKIVDCESAVLEFMINEQSDLLDALDQGDWNDDLESRLSAALDDFKATGSW